LSGVDRAIRVTLPENFAEVAGAVLMDLLGPFELESLGAPAFSAPTPAGGTDRGAEPGAEAVLTFYPSAETTPSLEDVLVVLPPAVRVSGQVRLETRDVSRDWVEGWREHFRPVVIGEVRIRPPWEPAPEGVGPAGAASDGVALVDVVINPGLGFGTGLHPTTRGTLRLLQAGHTRRGSPAQFRGPLVDAGTGSGILAIAAAKLGWGPVFAFDNDPVALASARENVAANGVGGIVEVHQTDVAGASSYWFGGATVLANMTLEPVLVLVRKLAYREHSWTGGEPTGGQPCRLVVSGILAGQQESELLGVAGLCGLSCGERLYEAEWVSLELLPVSAGEMPCTTPGGW
jgi:ribosomal protein L11 methyltransferase